METLKYHLANCPPYLLFLVALGGSMVYGGVKLLAALKEVQ